MVIKEQRQLPEAKCSEDMGELRNMLVPCARHTKPEVSKEWGGEPVQLRELIPEGNLHRAMKAANVKWWQVTINDKGEWWQARRQTAKRRNETTQIENNRSQIT